jgi:lipopolysaccharide/colanic/teichoic acid biosynthesis glycosyltransferase
MSVTISTAKVNSIAQRKGLPRWLEFLLALISLILLLPLLLVVAVIVKLTSKGPVLFRQERVGRFGKNFMLYKFRTMRVGNRGPQVTIKKDNRITWIGNILRKTKLDELPELWNIVRGDLSIVGPRPEVPNYVSLANPLWQEVLQVRPGITDTVTLRLRNEEEMLAAAKDPEQYYLDVLQPEKLKGYLSYLQNRSLKSDLWVIKETFVAIVFPFESPPPGIEEEHTQTENQQQKSFIADVFNFGRIKVIADFVILVLAFIVSYLLRFEFVIPKEIYRDVFIQTVMVVMLEYFILYISNIRKFIWRYISLAELSTFVRAAIFSAVPLIILRLTLSYSWHELRIPLSVILMNSIYAFGGLMGIRIFRRLMFERYEKRKISARTLSDNRKPVFLIGAGRAGQMAAREITLRGDSNFEIKGFIDDDISKQGKVILGIKVCGTTKDLSRLTKEMNVDNAILTIAHAPAEELQRIVEICDEAELNLRIMPGLYKLIDDHAGHKKIVDAKAEA